MAKAKKKAAAKASTTRTKSSIYGELADAAGITRKQVATVFDCMSGMIKKDLTRGPGQFTVPGLMKVTVRKKPAQKAIKNWTNPFTGEIMTKPAKPASKVVKVRPLKRLKDMI